jgi:lysophospholipase L1-like esterase
MSASFAGCTRQSGSTGPNVVLPPPDTISAPVRVNYLALGDSYTIGQSVATESRFPHQAAAILNSRGYRLNEPQYIAQTGWTTNALLNAIQTQNPPANFDVVSLLIGVNNQYQRRSQDEYRQQFSTCLQQAIRLAGNRKNRVFVLSIPDYSVTPFARNADTAKIAREIDEFNRINKEITLAAGIVYIDITPGSREGRNDASLIANDGLHPSGKEYAKWAALLADAMTPVLR